MCSGLHTGWTREKRETFTQAQRTFTPKRKGSDLSNGYQEVSCMSVDGREGFEENVTIRCLSKRKETRDKNGEVKEKGRRGKRGGGRRGGGRRGGGRRGGGRRGGGRRGGGRRGGGRRGGGRRGGGRRGGGREGGRRGGVGEEIRSKLIVITFVVHMCVHKFMCVACF